MADAFRNHIIGVVRFSYPSSNGFRLMDKQPARRIAALYDKARLEQRFHLFEGLTIPSLVAQSDGDFTLAVLVGSDLPAWAVARLQAALASLANARVVTMPGGLEQIDAAERLRSLLLRDDATHVTEFRLDDDDAIDRDHISRLKARAAVLAPMLGLNRPLVIGCNRGLVLHLDQAGHVFHDVTEKLPIGIGLAITVPRRSKVGIFRRNHRLLPQFFSTFTDADVPAFIRTVHATNDSEPHSSGQSRILTDAEVSTILAAHFPFDLSQLSAL